MIEEERSARSVDTRLLARLLSYLRPYGAWVVLAFVLILTLSAVQQAGPYVTKIAIDDHIAADINRIGIGANEYEVPIIVAIS